MDNVWHSIPAERVHPEDFLAVIEIPKGSKNKYELDKETGFIILDRILYTSTQTLQLYGSEFWLPPWTDQQDSDLVCRV